MRLHIRSVDHGSGELGHRRDPGLRLRRGRPRGGGSREPRHQAAAGLSRAGDEPPPGPPEAFLGHFQRQWKIFFGGGGGLPYMVLMKKCELFILW